MTAGRKSAMHLCTDRLLGVETLHRPASVRLDDRHRFYCGRLAIGPRPANLLLDEEAAAQLDAQTGTLTSGTTAFAQNRATATTGAWGRQATFRSLMGIRWGQPVLLLLQSDRRRSAGQGNDHPTVKPLALMKYLLTLLSTPTGGVILDPFAGSGTTALAARRLGRPCVCVELDEHNCEIAANRLESA